jgi:aldehyde:ferredoxin oxidoreductase
VKWTKVDQDYVALVDSAILCWIIYHGPLWGEKLQLWLNVVTGLEYGEKTLAWTGEKIWNMERIFNLQAGLTSKDDALPKRMTHEPRVKGQVVHMDRMLPEYYALRGWDEKGVPKQEKLAELGLSEEGVGDP